MLKLLGHEEEKPLGPKSHNAFEAAVGIVLAVVVVGAVICHKQIDQILDALPRLIF